MKNEDKRWGPEDEELMRGDGNWREDGGAVGTKGGAGRSCGRGGEGRNERMREVDSVVSGVVH